MPELINCEEYNKIYPDDEAFWAWVDAMEQDYIKQLTLIPSF